MNKLHYPQLQLQPQPLEDSEHVNMWLGKLFFLSMLVLLLFLKKCCFFDHIVDRTLKAVHKTLPTYYIERATSQKELPKVDEEEYRRRTVITSCTCYNHNNKS